MTGAVVLTVLAGLLAAWLWRKASQSWLVRLLWHWHSGLPLDGQSRTNATWLRRAHGDRPVLHPSGHAVRWHHWPRLHRAGIRTGSEVVLAVLLYGWAAYRTLTLATLAAVAVLPAALIYGKARSWRHTRNWVKPLNEALPPGVTVRELPRDRSRTVLALPAGFTGDDKDRKVIMQAAAAKLNPGAELHGDWSHLHGKRPEVVITPIQPPPGYVGFADIRPYADAAEEHEIVLGLSRPRPQGCPRHHQRRQRLAAPRPVHGLR